MKKAVISSTVLDLPEHRREVREACLRQKVFPLMMEYLPALDADAIQASLALVDEADIYIGVFGYRYGHQPTDHEISITEMEYNRAVQRGIPRFIFLMADDHPIKRSDVECGEAEQKLNKLKSRFNRVCASFLSSVDLRAHVIDTLAQWRVDAIMKQDAKDG